MAYNAQILLGRITKVHGYEGAVTVKLEKTFTEEDIPELESVFLEIDGKPVPFFITESDYPGADILRLKFEGFESHEKVIGFAGCRVFLTSYKTAGTTTNGIKGIEGYKVCLPDNTPVGTIFRIIENPGQQLLILKTENGKEIFIPLHEDFIIEIDNKKKFIIMDLPEGLTEIN